MPSARWGYGTAQPRAGGAVPRPRLTVTPRRRSGRRGHVRDREADASVAAARFDEDAGLQHVPQVQARGAPRLEVIGDGDRPARAFRRANAVELVPVRDAAAAVPTGAGRVPLDHVV